MTGKRKGFELEKGEGVKWRRRGSDEEETWSGQFINLFEPERQRRGVTESLGLSV